MVECLGGWNSLQVDSIGTMSQSSVLESEVEIRFVHMLEQLAPARCAPATAPVSTQKRRESARRTSGRVAARPDSSCGNESSYWRTGAAGSTQSTRCAAVPAIRRPARLGHGPRS
jgi:hypothetical protein